MHPTAPKFADILQQAIVDSQADFSVDRLLTKSPLPSGFAPSSARADALALPLLDAAKSPPNSISTPSSTGASRGTGSSQESLKTDDHNDHNDTFMSAANQANRHPTKLPPGARQQDVLSADSAAPFLRPGSSSSPSQPSSGPPPRRSPARQSSGPSPNPNFHQQQQKHYTHPAPVSHQYLPTPYPIGYGQSSYPSPYTMSTQHPSQLVQSPPHFAFTHAYPHPAIHAHAPQEPLLMSPTGMPYVSTSQQQQQPQQQSQHTGQMVAFQRSASEDHVPQSNFSPLPVSPTPSSYQHHVGDPTATTGPPASSSMLAHSPHAPPSPFGQFPVYGGSPVPQPFYPAHTYAASPPALYQGQYTQAPYGTPFMAQTGEESKGTWWYIPARQGSSGFEPQSHSFSSAYQMGYPAPQPHPLEPDTYGGQASGSRSPFPTSPIATSPFHQTGSFPPSGPPSSDHPSLAQSPVAISPQSSRFGRTSVPQSPARMHYHPSVPASRSEWVMWIGNVPSDATQEELWRFFNSSPPHNPTGQAHLAGGVTSIFLISRSNCAFVNYVDEAHLEHAVQHFNSQPLRPQDPRCPRLVCRVRRKDDDLKAGVGGQRGAGMHTTWVKEKKAAKKSEEDSVVSGSNDERPQPVPLQQQQASNSSGSYASTNSSFLTKHFPKRYFIMKSLSEFDLNLSIQNHLWATQPHNEAILDQAFRTSKEGVFLIFGANKSGEFFGYARMASGILQSERRPPWASTTRSQPSPRLARTQLPNAIPEEDMEFSAQPPQEDASKQRTDRTPPLLFSPGEHRLAEASPAPLTPGDTRALEHPRGEHKTTQVIHSAPEPPQPHRDAFSAPAELGPPHQRVSLPDGPAHAGTTWDVRKANLASMGASASQTVRETQTLPAAQPNFDPTAAGPEPLKQEQTWGTPFKVEWIRTDRLPFHRVRNLRNPWNHDREVKVSRDGTELEPSVGQRLLDEWDRPDPAPSSPAAPASRRSSRARGGGPPNVRVGSRS